MSLWPCWNQHPQSDSVCAQIMLLDLCGRTNSLNLWTFGQLTSCTVNSPALSSSSSVYISSILTLDVEFGIAYVRYKGHLLKPSFVAFSCCKPIIWEAGKVMNRQYSLKICTAFIPFLAKGSCLIQLLQDSLDPSSINTCHSFFVSASLKCKGASCIINELVHQHGVESMRTKLFSFWVIDNHRLHRQQSSTNSNYSASLMIYWSLWLIINPLILPITIR